MGLSSGLAQQWLSLSALLGPVDLTLDWCVGGRAVHACYAPLPAGAGYRRGDWGCTTVALQVGQSTWVEFSLMLPKCKENANDGAHQLLRFLVGSLILKSSCSSHLLQVASSSLLCCAKAVQFSLKDNYSKYRCAFSVFLGEASSVSSCAAILDLPKFGLLWGSH